MKPIVLMHSCSVWPLSVDRDVFQCYLAGYSVEETVERLMTETASVPDDGVPGPRASTADRPSQPHSATTALAPSDAGKLSGVEQPQHEDRRVLDHASDSETALLPGRLCPNEPVKLVIASEEIHTPVSVSALYSPTATATTAESMGPHKRSSNDHKGQQRVPHKKRAQRTHDEKPTATAGAAHATGTTNATSGRARGRRQKSFFLNEDYLDFQRRLLQVEGGPQSYAAALKSQLLFEEVSEQYQFFEVVTAEEYLGRPYSFLTCTYLPLSVEERLRLVRAYYPTDEVVRRYFFGDKMTKLSGAWADPSALASAANGGAAGVSALQRVMGVLLAPLRQGPDSTEAVLPRYGTDLHGTSAGSPVTLGPSGTTAASAGGANNGMAAAAAGAGAGGEHASLSGLSSEAQANLDLVALSQIPAVSLRRQWENIKNVATSLASMYRGKSGLYLPRDVPLRTAVEQCYALEGELASSYATMTFGFEHRLDIKLFKRFHSFAEYETICTILGSVWCDGSMLLLDEAFIEGCRRIARLLDETRVVAELHTLVFGEVMRPRWQVQLDEVQRAITTTSTQEREAARAVVAATLSSPSLVSGSPVGAGTCGNTTNSSSSNSNTNNALGASVRVVSPPPAVLSASVASGPPTAVGSPAALTRTDLSAAAGVPAQLYTHSPLGASLSATAGASGVISGHAGHAMPGSATTTTAPVSANKLFSRRLTLEFPGMMKHLSRAASQLGVNENVADALDIFFHRIYVYLETVSSRAAPGLVSLVLQQQHKAASHATSGGLDDESALLSQSAPVTTVFTGSPPGSRSLRRAASSAVPVSPSSPLAQTYDGARAAATGVASPPPAGAAAALPQLVAPSSFPTALLNASVMQPAAAFFATPTPPLAAPALPRPTSLASVGGDGNASGAVAVEPRVLAASTGPEDGAAHSSPTSMAAPRGSRPASPSARALPTAAAAASTTPTAGPTATGAAALPPGAVEAAVLRAVDKRLLRELCQTLNLLPKAWLQLTALSAEDHDVCDAPFNRLVMGLKAISQVLMATDDFS